MKIYLNMDSIISLSVLNPDLYKVIIYILMNGITSTIAPMEDLLESLEYLKKEIHKEPFSVIYWYTRPYGDKQTEIIILDRAGKEAVLNTTFVLGEPNEPVPE